MTKETNLRDMALHCNNFLDGSYCDDFKRLGDEIFNFRSDEMNKPSTIRTESVAGRYSFTKSFDSTTGAVVSWQDVFRKELALFTKIRLI
ncbi:MAG: hypothetical protein LRY71_19165 [Bacillaceae bacterium]|nr:hypothetical protein [Bacillaceae bacterium]